MPAWAKAALDRWTAAAAIEEGRLFRALSQKGEVAEALTAQAVYLIVKGYAEQLGIATAPHNLRRTFAKLDHRGRLRSNRSSSRSGTNRSSPPSATSGSGRTSPMPPATA